MFSFLELANGLVAKYRNGVSNECRGKKTDQITQPITKAVSGAMNQSEFDVTLSSKKRGKSCAHVFHLYTV